MNDKKDFISLCIVVSQDPIFLKFHYIRFMAVSNNFAQVAHIFFNEISGTFHGEMDK